jgi:hypothetical protein
VVGHGRVDRELQSWPPPHGRAQPASDEREGGVRVVVRSYAVDVD